MLNKEEKSAQNQLSKTPQYTNSYPINIISNKVEYEKEKALCRAA